MKTNINLHGLFECSIDDSIIGCTGAKMEFKNGTTNEYSANYEIIIIDKSDFKAKEHTIRFRESDNKILFEYLDMTLEVVSGYGQPYCIERCRRCGVPY